MTYTAREIRKAITLCGSRRPTSLDGWTACAVGARGFGALDYARNAETARERDLFVLVDSVAHGIRWAETTGRTMTQAFHAPFAANRDIVERIVAVCLRAGNQSADFVKDCWKEIGGLRDQHNRERETA